MSRRTSQHPLVCPWCGGSPVAAVNVNFGSGPPCMDTATCKVCDGTGYRTASTDRYELLAERAGVTLGQAARLGSIREVPS